MPNKRKSAEELQEDFINAVPASGEIAFGSLAETLDRDVLQQWHNLKHTGRINTRTVHDDTTGETKMYVSRV